MIGELAGVIVHEGQSIDSGHYYSYVRGMWELVPQG